ncbi:hypothetical protein [Amycolatopsis magusensis]
MSRRATCATTYPCAVSFGGIPHDEVLKSIRLIGELIPGLR